MKLAQKELRTFKDDIAGMFRFAADEGIDAVQIHLPDAERLQQIKAAMSETGIQVASVNAMSCDMLGPDKGKQAYEHQQVTKALRIADELEAPTVTNFAGFDYTRTLTGNAEEFARVYSDHAREAEQRGLKICFENCPMYGGLPFRARNMACCPANWRLLFAACDSPALGIELDTAHAVYMGLDAAQLIRDWHERIAHIQIKDARLDHAARQQQGLHAGIPHSLVPLGEGDLDADAVFSAISAINYHGYITSDIEGTQIDAARRNIAAIKAQLLEKV